MYSFETPIEREIQSLGEDYLFQDSLESILDEADDLIIWASRDKDNYDQPIYAVSFVTLWEVDYYRCNWEYDEWDMNWWMVGRVDISQLAYQITAAQDAKGGQES